MSKSPHTENNSTGTQYTSLQISYHLNSACKQNCMHKHLRKWCSEQLNVMGRTLTRSWPGNGTLSLCGFVFVLFVFSHSYQQTHSQWRSRKKRADVKFNNTIQIHLDYADNMAVRKCLAGDKAQWWWGWLVDTRLLAESTTKQPNKAIGSTS